MSPRLIDAHTHTHFAAYRGETKEVISRALAEDIWLVNIGTQKDTSEGAIKVAEEYKEGVYASVGLHPIHTAKSYHDEDELGNGQAAKAFTSRGEKFDFDTYKKLAEHEKVVAIGECGLDYYRMDEGTKEKQFEAFMGNIEVARAVNKPLMIHCRNAFADLIKLLKENKDKLKGDYPGVVHFFAGTPEEAEELKELGFYFSFGGVITFTRDYDEAIKKASLERILLETDAPYVAPVPFRGKRNEPLYVKYTADKLAEILGKEPEEVYKRTTDNARAVLGI
jgi:TatD DNase family protein